jgi:hypothetical protein
MLESHWILQENTGNRWNMEAVFRPKIARIFPVDSCQLPVLSVRNRPEIIGKNPKNFWPEYCFHVPAISGVFLPEPPVLLDLG